MLKLLIVSAYMTLALSQSYFKVEGTAQSKEADYGPDPMMFMNMLNNGSVNGYKEFMKNIPFSEILDNSTTSGFLPEVERSLSMAKPDLCERTVDTCSQAMFLDCNCVKQFTTMKNKECNGVLCDLFDAIYEGAVAKHIKAFSELTSFEDAFTYYNDQILPSIMDYTCACKDEFFNATISCISKYDSMVLKMMPEEEIEQFKEVMKSINWIALESLTETLAEHSCKNIDGEICYKAYGRYWENWAAMLDNTFSGKGGSCNSFKDLINGVIKLTSESGNDDSFTSIFDTMYKVSRKWICKSKCAKSHKEKFLEECCVIAVIKDKSIVNNYLKFMESIIPLLSDGAVEKIPPSAKKQIKNLMDPLKMCKNKKTKAAWKDVLSSCKNDKGKFYF